MYISLNYSPNWGDLDAPNWFHDVWVESVPRVGENISTGADLRHKFSLPEDCGYRCRVREVNHNIFERHTVTLLVDVIVERGSK